MGFFDSKSSSNVTNQTSNTDKRIATGEGGFVFQTDGANSVVNFEDINQDVVNSAMNLAASFIGEASRVFDKAYKTTDQSIASTQALAQNLFEEKNTPSSDNMRNMVYALTAAASVVGVAYIFRRK